VCTFIVILFNCDELWFYFINCSFADVMQSSGAGHDEFFFNFKNLLVETGMLLLLQFCTTVTGGDLPVSTLGVTAAT
jgi:hypothetical protein